MELLTNSHCFHCLAFQDCRIRDGADGIHLTLNRDGKPSGEAFIELDYEEDVQKALEKHRQYLGPRYVEGMLINADVMAKGLGSNEMHSSFVKCEVAGL